MDKNYFDDLQLFHFNACPYCLKVRIAMKYMGIDMLRKNIKENPEHRCELVECGGKKQVPCLRIQEHDGVNWLYESSDIIRYLSKRAAS
ncbi:MAG: glutathione S-transferase N-terminal domain-containing protein [Pseudomonadales bacterium]